MIRHAVAEDQDAIAELATTFLAEAGYPLAAAAAADITARCLAADMRVRQAEELGDLNVAVLAGVHRDAVELGGLFVIDHDGTIDGFFGFIVGTHPVTGEWTAFELGWYVRHGQRRGMEGIRLLLQATEESIALGADALQVSVLDDRLGRFLETEGFVKREMTYIRRLDR